MLENRAKGARNDYDRLAKAEIEHYTKIFLGEGEPDQAQVGRGKLFQPVPPAWIEMEKRAAQLIRQQTGSDVTEHALRRLRRVPGVRMLSLGSGPGGIELALAREAREAEITCMDFNPALVQLGQEQALRDGLRVTFQMADLNTVVLPEASFDVVFCHASLHHTLELERLAEQIRSALRPDGELIVVDVITRNGYLMWPETREIVDALWKTLPTRFRMNHTAYSTPHVDEEIWEADTSQGSMECVRSQDILPVLTNVFAVRQFVPCFCICRRFLDTMYGPNYDLAEPLDLALLNWIWELDVHYLATKRLRPETIFGIFAL